MKCHSETFNLCAYILPIINTAPARWQSFIDCQLAQGVRHEDIVEAISITKERLGARIKYKSVEESVQYSAAILKSIAQERDIESRIFYESFPITL